MELKNPWLIQRAKFQNSNSPGLNSILKFSYMGSAEFEYGAIPRSLSRIKENIDFYHYESLVFSENLKSVIIFCLKEHTEQIKEFIKNLTSDNYRLKEYCDFKEWIVPSDQCGNYYDFYWDIENDYMFWKGDNSSFTEDFAKLIIE